MIAIILSTFALCTVFSAQKTAVSHAESTQEPTGATLFLPNTYEQYLPLTEPTDIAVTDSYIAVADKQTVYVYNKAEGKYSSYEHSANVNELQFSGDTLYFLDQGMNLFKTATARLPSEPIPLSEAVQHCISFSITSDKMYFTKKSGGKAQIYSAPLVSPLQETKESGEFPAETDPAIAVDDGSLYYTHEGVNSHLYRLGNENSFEVLLPQKTISSIAVSGDTLYYTAGGTFYVYNVTALRQNESGLIFEREGNFSALCSAEDGYIYAVDGKTVKRYSPKDVAFTDYEISSSSASTNRLSGATDVALSGNLLAVADQDNERISLTDLASGQTQTIPSIPATQIVTDGETALCANSTTVALYDLKEKTQIKTYGSFPTEIVGIAGVYGNYYIATQGGFAKIDKTGELSPVSPSNKTPKLLCSDVYGKLYVGYADGSVYGYSESEILAPQTDEQREKIATLPIDTEKIAVDLNGVLYALNNGTLTKYAKTNEETF
ncbi:MAG: hypothetical protein IIX01_01485, partial [Clostridia bacterium]|nr:hypothetical protein [Clostridia bacterium]